MTDRNSGPDTEQLGSESVTFLGDFSKKLVTNTFFNFVGRCWNFLATLLLTPYILSHLDVNQFGVWVLLSIFTSSFNLLDLGMGAAFVKHISEYYTRRDFDRLNKAIFSGLIFYLLFGAGLTAIGLALERPLFRVFRIPAGFSDVYLLVLIGFSVLNLSNVFLSALRGIQRMDKSNAVEMGMSVPSMIGTVLFLRAGYGMQGMALNGVIMPVLMTVLAWWTLKSVLPQAALIWRFDGALFREMFAYGLKMQVSRFGSTVSFQGDKLIISRFHGPATVSFYEVGSRLTSAMRAIPLVLMSGLIPATSELDARNDREKILRAYELASKYVSMLTVALVSLCVLEASALVHLWLGAGYDESILLIQILAIGYGANVMGGAASQTGAGIGKPEFDMKSTMLLIVLNPMLSLMLVRKFGPSGAALGTMISLITAACYLLWIFHRDYWVNSAWRVIRDIHLRPIISGVLAVFAVVGLHELMPAAAALESVRYLIPVKITLDFLIFSPTYVLLLIALRHVTTIDWNNFMGLLNFGVEFLRHPVREGVKIYR
jgi:O-antigen/teichoic acid export membrane protein